MAPRLDTMIIAQTSGGVYRTCLDEQIYLIGRRRKISCKIWRSWGIFTRLWFCESISSTHLVNHIFRDCFVLCASWHSSIICSWYFSGLAQSQSLASPLLKIRWSNTPALFPVAKLLTLLYSVTKPRKVMCQSLAKVRGCMIFVADSILWPTPFCLSLFWWNYWSSMWHPPTRNHDCYCSDCLDNQHCHMEPTMKTTIPSPCIQKVNTPPQGITRISFITA